MGLKKSKKYLKSLGRKQPRDGSKFASKTTTNRSYDRVTLHR